MADRIRDVAWEWQKCEAAHEVSRVPCGPDSDNTSVEAITFKCDIPAEISTLDCLKFRFLYTMDGEPRHTQVLQIPQR